MNNPFERILLEEVIPMIDAGYRTIADREHRAMAGLSMGGGQTINIAFNKPDLFRYVALMSPAASGRVAEFYPEHVRNPAPLNKQFKLFWIGVGKDDGLTGPGDHAFAAALDPALRVVEDPQRDDLRHEVVSVVLSVVASDTQ